MPDDPLFMVQKALMDAGADRGAKRWYTCSNGHPFAIGACGGAMEVSRCPECNEEIGGTDHTLKDTNVALGEVTGGDSKALFQAGPGAGLSLSPDIPLSALSNSYDRMCLRARSVEMEA